MHVKGHAALGTKQSNCMKKEKVTDLSYQGYTVGPRGTPDPCDLTCSKGGPAWRGDEP